jgi:hypothetical protein
VLDTDAVQPIVAHMELEPIDGVSLELYVEISKSLARVGYDQAKGPAIAASMGITAAAWATAASGWNDRIRADPAIARRFNDLYTGG